MERLQPKWGDFNLKWSDFSTNGATSRGSKVQKKKTAAIRLF
ncbi:hypothetical protein QS257_01780 [Terrilactibacillus sp. S3-3]|nr:hypothetical protein QS257_01780 [Terrilactibacillus sp. S3-3]